MSSSKSESNKQPYLHKGQVLSSPPFSARLRSFMTEAEAFLGLYVTTLFSFDPHASAQQWQADRAVNIHAQGRGGARNTNATVTTGWGFNRGSGGGGGSGPGGSAVRGRRLGTVDDVRGPECKSCS